MHRRRHRWRRGTGGQAIRQFLEPCLLLLLHRGESYGYELMGALAALGFGPVAPGPVYRTLRQLEGAGFVQSAWDTESSAGPARRVYRITEAGDRYLAAWVQRLRETRNTLNAFLEAYERHMQEDAEKSSQDV